MQSQIAKAIDLEFEPVAIIWSDEEPQENIMQFSPGKWGCIMWLVASAAKGKATFCDRETFGCLGGGVGMGFGEQYKNFPGGEDCFCYFLSVGNEQWQKGRQMTESVKTFMPKESLEHFIHGERYFKSPETAKKFVNNLPVIDIPSKYVIFKPLSEIETEKEQIKTIIFFADPDQISALTVLANYEGEHNENVIMPYGAGCQTIGIYPYREATSPNPRAVVGLTDLSARVYIRKQLGSNLLTFSVPLSMYKKMERNVTGSFLEMGTWQTLLQGRKRV